MSTAQKIKEMRKKTGLSQKELAKKTGLSIATIQGYEQGKYLPKIDGFYRLQTAFNCYLNDIMDPDDVIPNSDFSYKLFAEVAGLSEPEGILLEYFDLLNAHGQNNAIEHVKLLTKIPEYQKDNNQ